MFLASALPKWKKPLRSMKEEQAEEATHLDSSLEAPAQEQETWTPSSGNSEKDAEQNRGMQLRGVIEEEEIEEEESDLPRFEEDLDMGEFEELEEKSWASPVNRWFPWARN